MFRPTRLCLPACVLTLASFTAIPALAQTATPTPPPTPTGTPTPVSTLPPGIDPTLDPDRDGLTNDLEAYYGTNRDVADSDGDYFNDGQEVAVGSNPRDPASFPTDRIDSPFGLTCGSTAAAPLALLGLGLLLARRRR